MCFQFPVGGGAGGSLLEPDMSFRVLATLFRDDPCRRDLGLMIYIIIRNTMNKHDMKKSDDGCTEGGPGSRGTSKHSLSEQ